LYFEDEIEVAEGMDGKTGWNGSSQGSHQVSMEKTAWDVVHLLDNLLTGLERPIRMDGMSICALNGTVQVPLITTHHSNLPLHPLKKNKKNCTAGTSKSSSPKLMILCALPGGRIADKNCLDFH
jgi:hypothetical protein